MTNQSALIEQERQRREEALQKEYAAMAAVLDPLAADIARATGLPARTCWRRIDDGGPAGGIDQGLWLGTRQSGNTAKHLMERLKIYGEPYIRKVITVILRRADQEARAELAQLEGGTE